MTYAYTLPKCGHPRSWRRSQLNAVREYWFQLCDGDEQFVKRKTFTWAGACNYGDTWFSLEARSRSNEELVMFLIDGRVPREELVCPPTDAIWNRWERSPFVEDGWRSRSVVLMSNGLVVEV